jgi:hypothetical protein
MLAQFKIAIVNSPYQLRVSFFGLCLLLLVEHRLREPQRAFQPTHSRTTKSALSSVKDEPGQQK